MFLRLSSTAALFLAGVACLPPDVSVVGKECSDDHPCGEDLKCCEGVCRAECHPCPDRACTLRFAIDCAQERLCVDRCWEPCPTCGETCSDDGQKACTTGRPGEVWFCRNAEVCMLRSIMGDRSKGCLTPPPQCIDQIDCDCLTTEWFTAGPYWDGTPCESPEICQSGSNYITCYIPPPPDAGSSADAGSVPPDASSSYDHSTFDVGIRDAGEYLDGTTAADAGSWPDAASNDSGSCCQDAGIEPEAGAQDSGHSDAGSSLDSSSAPDVARSDTARPDTARPDTSQPDVATVCGPVPPDCFRGIGTGALGDNCCAEDPSPAECSEWNRVWSCADGEEFSSRCNGYGDTCMNGEIPECTSTDVCVWAWTEQDSRLRCTDYGPAIPCVDGDWRCVTDTAPLSSCNCVEPSCP